MRAASRSVAALFFAVSAAWPAAAQGVADFGAISVAVGGGYPMGTAWAGAWEPTPAIGATLSTPFHHGWLELGARAWRNDRTVDDLPDFTAIHATAGWGPTVALPGRVRLSPVASAGALAFRFDDEDDFTGALRNETELTAGLQVRADVGLAARLRAWAAADAVHVFTSPSEDLLFLEVGLSLTLPAPGWLRGALVR